MTGDKIFLKDYKTIDVEHVTFGDGVKGRVLGKGTLDFEGLPRLKNMLHVKGLTANLISISQLCDQNLLVKFTKIHAKFLLILKNLFWKEQNHLIIVTNYYNHTHITRPPLMK